MNPAGCQEDIDHLSARTFPNGSCLPHQQMIALAGADLRREPRGERKVDLRRLLVDAGPGAIIQRMD
jgi:hypothetical protein